MLQAEHIDLMKKGNWQVAAFEEGERMLCVFFRAEGRPTALLLDQSGSLYQCRLWAPQTLFLGTVLLGSLVTRSSSYSFQVLSFESFQGQQRRYGPEISATILKSLGIRFESPALKLEYLDLQPLQNLGSLVNRSPAGLWFASEHYLLTWRPHRIIEALWKGGKVLLAKTCTGFLTLEEALPSVTTIRIPVDAFSDLKPPRIVRLALAGNVLVFLTVLPALRTLPDVIKLSSEPSYLSELLRVSEASRKNGRSYPDDSKHS
jgi:hypothetical protein